jgi:hypothetical protein
VHGAYLDVPEVRTVDHVHGACVEGESDGYPEAWFTKEFKQVGRDFRKLYDKFKWILLTTVRLRKKIILSLRQPQTNLFTLDHIKL